MAERKRLPRERKQGNILLALVLTLFIFTAAVVLVLNFKWLYYIDITILGLEEKSGMTVKEIRANYDALIQYNQFWFHGDLKFPTLFMSETGRIHFQEVKQIFTAVQYLCMGSGIASLIGIIRHARSRRLGYLKIAGILTFAGDVIKCVVAFLIVFFMYRGSDCRPLLTLYAGAGVTLGHNFPFYMNFKGGKGIAVMAGLVAVNSFWHLPMSLLMIPVTLACFLVPVIVTRYISVGSLAAYTVFLIEMVIIGQMGWLDMQASYCYELYVILALMTILAWYRHKENLKRLAAGTENKFGSKKKE